MAQLQDRGSLRATTQADTLPNHSHRVPQARSEYVPHHAKLQRQQKRSRTAMVCVHGQAGIHRGRQSLYHLHRTPLRPQRGLLSFQKSKNSLHLELQWKCLDFCYQTPDKKWMARDFKRNKDEKWGSFCSFSVGQVGTWQWRWGEAVCVQLLQYTCVLCVSGVFCIFEGFFLYPVIPDKREERIGWSFCYLQAWTECRIQTQNSAHPSSFAHFQLHAIYNLLYVRYWNLLNSSKFL